MKLSESNKSTLLVSVHRSIEEHANCSANHIFHGRFRELINYPTNGGFTENELVALDGLKEKEDLKSALRKVIASATADTFFDFFNIIDGTTDPDPIGNSWSEVMIVDTPPNYEEDIEFWHDDFYGSYWDWKEIRQNHNWSLDLE